MFRSRFLWKLYAGYVALILGTTAMVGGLISRRIEQDSLSEIQLSLRTKALLLVSVARHSLENSADPSKLQEPIRVLGAQVDTRFTVIQADGVVIADSEKDPSQMDNHGNRPEVLAARSHNIGTATRFSDTLRLRMMYVALPVESNGHFLGYVRASLPLFLVDDRIRQNRYTIFLGAAIATVVALALGFVFARRFSEQLTSMTAVAEAMAEGDYEQRLTVGREDEIGKLAVAFNRMAESCRDRMDTINTDRNKLLAILAGMVEGVVAVDRDERILHMNAVAGRILGSSPEDSLGRPLWEVTRVQDVSKTLTKTLSDREELEGELRLAVPMGDRTVEMYTSPLQDGEGNLVGAVLVLHDVSELYRVEQVRRDFVANVSHELKTPIAAVRGLVETLIDHKGMSSESQERFLAKIRNQSMRLSSIVTDLLALSRLESGKSLLTSRSLDLRDVIRTSVKALQQAAEEKDIKVEIQVPEAPVKLLGDQETLSQMTSNLLDNAVKYSPRGADVWIRLRQDIAGAMIEVEDTGVGIESRDQNRIFERFYRVDKARSRELGGTGLGLSIVKHIARAHGGEVSVISMPGQGSTFRVSLPLHAASS